ncbi:hypothetical protein K432DRAFT_168560 [Lepidopterella palustris CBS 459.81]|uniref:Uncharacterized protein n=1 Tax=Lepidopterella palustris CBS 459.81 TaxID=1314670 RepID=A0A8E2EL99_9PEZI|nr:hypothetical protein K432DRAFT_168560 [Lepidopterella palustris CBS 459.81]
MPDRVRLSLQQDASRICHVILQHRCSRAAVKKATTKTPPGLPLHHLQEPGIFPLLSCPRRSPTAPAPFITVPSHTTSIRRAVYALAVGDLLHTLTVQTSRAASPQCGPGNTSHVDLSDLGGLPDSIDRSAQSSSPISPESCFHFAALAARSRATIERWSVNNMLREDLPQSVHSILVASRPLRF